MEAELRRVLASVSDCLWSAVIDATGQWVYRYVSPVVEQITGRPPDYFLAGVSRWWGIVHADDRQRWEKALMRLRGGTGSQEEYRIVTADGSTRWVRDSVRVSRGTDGQTLWLDGVLTDVTQRRQAEAQVQESRRTLLTLLSNLPGMAYRCRNDPDWTMEFASEGTTALTGYPPDALIGNRTVSYAQLIHPDDRQMVWELVQAAIAEQQPFQVTYRIRTASGVEKWVWEQGRGVYGPNGELQALEGFITDISERKYLEEQLRQAQKMEAIGQLAGGVAHDFNNLLTAILGNVSLLLSNLPPGDPNRELLEATEQAAVRATDLTRQLLGFSRQTVLRLEPINLNHAIEEVLTILKRTIDPRIRVEVKAEPNLWEVQADAGQIHQVLLNLCLNARDAMPEGGTLRLETANRAVDERRARRHLEASRGEFVRLRVSDTGQGIPPEIRDRIFEPFFTTKGPGKGTGLGLAMVYGIVKQHQGWIECWSELTRGSRFDIYLPRAAVGATEPAAPAAPVGANGGSECILLVDDEAVIRNLGRTILQRQGYEVLLAEDGQQALELYQRERPRIDLIILDLTMPNLSGRDTLRHLRQIDPSVRVLLSSGYSADHVGDEERELVRGFVNKPYRPGDLTAAVRKALDSN
jgi:PAS domain S-box-containing protein